MDRCQRSNQPKIAYLLSSFPVLSETFVLQEVLELERQGLPLCLFSLFEPSVSKTAEVVWNRQTSVTYISRLSKLNLLVSAGRHFLKNPKRFLRSGILTVVHYPPRSAIRSLLYAACLSEQIEHQGITHLHAHFATDSTSVAQVVHLLTGLPYSFTAHAFDIFLSSKSSLAYKMSRARIVIACNIYNQEYLRKLVDRRIAEHLYCINYGLNLNIFPSNTQVASSPVATPLILVVSRVVEKKDYFTLYPPAVFSEIKATTLSVAL